MPNETAAERFARDWEDQEEDRVTAGLAGQTAERLARLYVAPNGDSAAEDYVAAL
jgi:hypothetical protein